MRIQKSSISGVLGALNDVLAGGRLVSGVLVSGVLVSSVFVSSHSAFAQVPNADLACYLHSPDGIQFDLSALCGDIEGEEGVVLQTGDVQITLRWDTADDLDLYVQDPAGDEVYFGNPSVPSGGLLDVDANANCAARMASPVENIFWPTGEGKPGDYVITVDLFSYCAAEAPINFTVTTLVQGVTTSQSGSVSADQTSVSFPFSFPSAATSTDAAPPAELPSAELPSDAATSAL